LGGALTKSGNEEIIEYLASEVDNYEMILAGIY